MLIQGFLKIMIVPIQAYILATYNQIITVSISNFNSSDTFPSTAKVS